jgi:hypothetical protein
MTPARNAIIANLIHGNQSTSFSAQLQTFADRDGTVNRISHNIIGSGIPNDKAVIGVGMHKMSLDQFAFRDGTYSTNRLHNEILLWNGPQPGFDTLQPDIAVELSCVPLTVASAPGSGKLIEVKETKGFFPGIHGIPGDEIYIEDGGVARITGKRLGENAFELDRPLKWNQGAGIFFGTYASICDTR